MSSRAWPRWGGPGVLLFLPGTQLHPDCGPARVGVCEPMGPMILNTGRLWLAFIGVGGACLSLLVGLVASAYRGTRLGSDGRPEGQEAARA
jgi:hypothetical protein